MLEETIWIPLNIHRFPGSLGERNLISTSLIGIKMYYYAWCWCDENWQFYSSTLGLRDNLHQRHTGRDETYNAEIIYKWIQNGGRKIVFGQPGGVKSCVSMELKVILTLYEPMGAILITSLKLLVQIFPSLTICRFTIFLFSVNEIIT